MNGPPLVLSALHSPIHHWDIRSQILLTTRPGHKVVSCSLTAFGRKGSGTLPVRGIPPDRLQLAKRVLSSEWAIKSLHLWLGHCQKKLLVELWEDDDVASYVVFS